MPTQYIRMEKIKNGQQSREDGIAFSAGRYVTLSMVAVYDCTICDDGNGVDDDDDNDAPFSSDVLFLCVTHVEKKIN